MIDLYPCIIVMKVRYFLHSNVETEWRALETVSCEDDRHGAASPCALSLRLHTAVALKGSAPKTTTHRCRSCSMRPAGAWARTNSRRRAAVAAGCWRWTVGWGGAGTLTAWLQTFLVSVSLCLESAACVGYSNVPKAAAVLCSSQSASERFSLWPRSSACHTYSAPGHDRSRPSQRMQLAGGGSQSAAAPAAPNCRHDDILELYLRLVHFPKLS